MMKFINRIKYKFWYTYHKTLIKAGSKNYLVFTIILSNGATFNAYHKRGQKQFFLPFNTHNIRKIYPVLVSVFDLKTQEYTLLYKEGHILPYNPNYTIANLSLKLSE